MVYLVTRTDNTFIAALKESARRVRNPARRDRYWQHWLAYEGFGSPRGVAMLATTFDSCSLRRRALVCLTWAIA